MQTNGVGGGHHSTGDDVVAIHQGASHGFADAIDVHWRRGDEGNDEADGRSQEGGDHQHAEPADVQPVVGAGNPVTEPLPS